MRWLALISIVACAAAGAGLCRAQTAAFESAAITQSEDQEGRSTYSTTATTLSLHNQTLKDCIRIAYDVKVAQVAGGAKWAETERYDIEAKTRRPTGERERMTMMQALLKERFKLDLHRETRMVPGYALAPAKGGIRIREVEPGPGNIRTRRGNITAQCVSMANLTAALSEMLRSPVLDETGATGLYTFGLDWTADLSPPGSLTADDPDTPTVLPENTPGPSLFGALVEQLGLKLESRKAQLSVLVIDRATRPK